VELIPNSSGQQKYFERLFKREDKKTMKKLAPEKKIGVVLALQFFCQNFTSRCSDCPVLFWPSIFSCPILAVLSRLFRTGFPVLTITIFVSIMYLEVQFSSGNRQNINRKFVRILTISAEKLSAECRLLEEVLLYKL
jgi:hypothetical protein